ncbi:B-cell receptor CD22-like isoform X2 [Dunckerocampus dactyliophorus]|uniref:B-cell receptor CD22-like isoform X2 n=1 Tax=Dunckerocampus dactyliophorus TaxID=161453 RepID=UPI002406544A|nr:B-cell receptor CD22-like isoform X2 [Dunckerocampus dactyliophorus]
MNLHAFICLTSVTVVAAADCPRNPRNLKNPFELSSPRPSAKAGSCIELILKGRFPTGADSNWFWIKDAIWNERTMDFTGTVILSSNAQRRPVHPDFAGRVNYVDGAPSSRSRKNILICNVTKSDSGSYQFRYVDRCEKWVTEPPVVVTVEDNPCPITFGNPSPVKENTMVTLTCSTLTSCPSRPQIGDGRLSPLASQRQTGMRSSFVWTAGWRDDGREFSCQTQDNTDTYLTQKITLLVGYAPKNTKASVWNTKVLEGDSVRLSCTSEGNPAPNFTWSTNEREVSTRGGWTITSIRSQHSGTYVCQATNVHGHGTSRIDINVKYAPRVEIISGSSTSTFTQGDEMALTCHVTRSNPPVQGYTWSKDGKPVQGQREYVVQSVQPEHAGRYTCRAFNDAGEGTSAPLPVQVEYPPRKTKVLVSGSDSTHIKVNTPLVLKCQTDANPAANKYSWSLHSQNKKTSWSSWPSEVTADILRVSSVQRRHEACYVCNATNRIASGDNSQALCIQVLYPPSKPVLSMAAEAREGELLPIVCSTESFPPSHFTLTRTSGQQSSVRPVADSRGGNLSITLNVTSADAGVYACEAANSQGRESTRRPLEVRYSPKDVTVNARPGLDVRENATLTLQCGAKSHPAVTSVTWWRMMDGRPRALPKLWTFAIESVTPSDSGLYGCTAANDIGTGSSPPVQVKVKYAPKLTEISKAEERQRSDGLSSVMLSCSSHAVPPARQHLWYKKVADGQGEDENVSDSQNHTVTSDQPGVYYCVAKNDVGDGTSEPVSVFLDGGFMKALKFLLPLLCVLVFLLLIFYICRRRRNKLIQDFASRRTAMTDNQKFAGCRAESRTGDPSTDNRATTSIHTVYSLLGLPPGGRGRPSAAGGLQDGFRSDDSVHYASLQFGLERGNEPDVVYAVVPQPKGPKKTGEEKLGRTTPAESSEDEVELNYSQLNFTPKSVRSQDTPLGSAREEGLSTRENI